MKALFLSTLALGAALLATPLCASAESNFTPDLSQTGAICGRIDVDPMKVVDLAYAPGSPENVIVARSATEVVTTSVQLDGSFCFAHLQPDLHEISAFGDNQPGEYNAHITPVPGKTQWIQVELGGGR
ncbi:MAG TPA: hypothetical protein VK702_13050 [Candidatus Acidoferrum sp.]|jgi:hypothetical protein|nr:hypothetical protein [Candidatus Acidoferrum sp.]